MTTVRYKAPFQRRRPKAPPQRPVQRSARMLALAHLLERLFESGELSSHQEAAELLGVTERRVSQIVTMLFLAPRIQEGILDGTLGIDGRTAQKVALERVWGSQERSVFRFRPNQK